VAPLSSLSCLALANTTRLTASEKQSKKSNGARCRPLGLFTRTVAFILAGNMAVAYFMAHAPRGFFPLLNGGELATVYCFVFLYLWVAGGGEWSLDRLRAPAPALSPSRA
jgi:hypothetical protein